MITMSLVKMPGSQGIDDDNEFMVVGGSHGRRIDDAHFISSAFQSNSSCMDQYGNVVDDYCVEVAAATIV